jgi:hypothetical protein
MIQNGQVVLNFKSDSTKSHLEETLRIEQEARASHKFNTKLEVKIVEEDRLDYLYTMWHVDKSGNCDLSAPMVFLFNNLGSNTVDTHY